MLCWRVGGVPVVIGSISASWNLSRNLSIYRDAMALGIHALDIPGIVALLADISGSSRRVGTGQAAGQQAGTGAYGCTMSAPNQCPCRRADACPQGGGSDSAGYSGIVRRNSAGSIIGELTAGIVIVPELFETPA